MYAYYFLYIFFFFNDTATTEIYTLSLHDALPIYKVYVDLEISKNLSMEEEVDIEKIRKKIQNENYAFNNLVDRKSTRLNSSHANISYAVFCLKKKKNIIHLSIQ